MSVGHHHGHAHTPEEPAQPDSWHRHTPDEGEPQAEHLSQVNPVTLGKVLFVLIAGTAAFIVVTVLYFDVRIRTLTSERIENDLSGYTSREAGTYFHYKDASDAQLSRFGWNGPEQVRIPVDEAKKKVIEQYAKRAAAE